MNFQNNKNSENNMIYIYCFTDKTDDQESKSFQDMICNFEKQDSKISTSMDTIIDYLTKIFFENTYIIIKETKFEDFISEFYKKMNKINVIPKFIIYTREKSDINKNKKNKSYFKYGGKLSSFEEILHFIQTDNIVQDYEISSFNYSLNVESLQEIKLIFDPIESIKQMYLPTYYKVMIKINEEDEKNIDKFTKSL